MTYDAAGNITEYMKFRSLKYDYANGRQSAVKLPDNTSVQSSAYDCAGQRVQTTAGNLTRTMVYDIFGQDVADYGYLGNGLERENIYRAGQLLATQEFPTTQNVVWTNATGVYVSGNSITKSGTTGWGYSEAVSAQNIASGDGYAEFTADSLDYGMYGLSHDNPDLDYTGIDYAIFTQWAEGNVFVYENGTSRGQVGTWTAGDRFQVAVEGGVVKYKKNGSVMYTSTVAPTYPLFVDSSLYNGNTLYNVVISGDFTGTAGLRYVLQDVQGSTRAVLNNNASSSAVMARQLPAVRRRAWFRHRPAHSYPGLRRRGHQPPEVWNDGT